MQRMNVDLPHPDGPMMAVTARPGNDREIDRSTWWFPNPASSSLTAIRSGDDGFGRAGDRAALVVCSMTITRFLHFHIASG